MTYAELLAAVQNYVQDTETSFVAQIPQMVRTVERRVYTNPSYDLPVEQSSASLTAATGVVNLSIAALTTFLSVDSLAVNNSGTYTYLDAKEEEYLRTAYPSTATQGQPRLFTVYDTGTIKLAPTPDQNYIMELRYFSVPTSIVDAGTSWLGTNFDDVLLYGTLVEAAAYLKEEPDIITNYAAKYKDALDRLASFADTRSKVDAYRNRRTRS